MDLLVTVAVLLVDFMDSGPGVLGGLLYLFIAGIPLTLLHELGHALVARRRLGSNVRVVVGTSGRLADVRLFGVTVSLNALAHPGRINGHAVVDVSYATRRDVALIALGGPAASFLGFAICAGTLSLAPHEGVVHGALWALTLGGAFACSLNLVPMTLREGRGGPAIRTDGGIVLDCVRAPRATTSRGTELRRSAQAEPSPTPAVVPIAGHLPLRGRAGAPLGVEPITRTSSPDIADDTIHRRARRLSANRHRSTPPPKP